MLLPQTTAVDIYFGNEYLATTLAKFNPNFIEFQTPEEIVNRIPLLKEKHIFFKQISVPMSPNAGSLCTRPNQKDCGILKPEIAEVIFDSGAFRADLFINPSLLISADEGSGKFLIESDVPYSYVNNIHTTASGDNKSDSNYNISGQSIFAHKQQRLRMYWDYNNAQSGSIERASWQKDKTGMEYEAGFFSTQSKSVNFIPDTDIVGLKYATSLKTRTDLITSKGSEIVVFFSSRSRVEIYRKGKLLDVQFYETGNQVIDSQRFPDGAYNIDLLIKDVAGRETQETHFFAKTAKLPPLNAPQYGIEIGKITNSPDEQDIIPTTSNSWVMRSSFSQRIRPDLGIEGTASFFSGQAHLETGIVKLGPNYHVSSGVLTSTDKDLGFSLESSYKFKNFSTTTGIRRIYTSASEQPFNSSYYDPISKSTTNLNTSLSFATFLGSINAQFIRTRRESDNAGETYLLRYNRSVATYFDSNVSFNAQAGKVRDVEQSAVEGEDDFIPIDKEFYSMGLSVFFFTKHLSTTLKGSYRDDLKVKLGEPNEQFSGTEYTFNSRWKDVDLLFGDLESSVFAKKALESETVGGDISYDSPYGRSKFLLQQTKTQEQLEKGDPATRQWAGSYGFGIIGNQKAIAFGGARQGLSAAIIEVAGEADNAYFDVIVNNSSKGSAGIGRRNVVTLRPYDTFNIYLKPKGDSFINFNNQNKRLTLYPGNVVSLDWAAQEVYVIFGRVLDQDGNTIPNARMTSVSGWSSSDDNGIFQAEIFGGTSELTFETEFESCAVTLPEYTIIEGIISIGDLTCTLAHKLDKTPADSLETEEAVTEEAVTEKSTTETPALETPSLVTPKETKKPVTVNTPDTEEKPIIVNTPGEINVREAPPIYNDEEFLEEEAYDESYGLPGDDIYEDEPFDEYEEVLSDDLSDDLADEISEEVDEELAEDLIDEFGDEFTDDPSAPYEDELLEDLPDELADEISSDLDEELTDEFVEDLGEGLLDEVEDDLSDELSDELADEITEELEEELSDNLTEELDGEFDDNLADELSDELDVDLSDNLPEELDEELTDDLTEQLDEALEEDLIEEEVLDEAYGQPGDDSYEEDPLDEYEEELNNEVEADEIIEDETEDRKAEPKTEQSPEENTEEVEIELEEDSYGDPNRDYEESFEEFEDEADIGLNE